MNIQLSMWLGTNNLGPPMTTAWSFVGPLSKTWPWEKHFQGQGSLPGLQALWKQRTRIWLTINRRAFGSWGAIFPCSLLSGLSEHNGRSYMSKMKLSCWHEMSHSCPETERWLLLYLLYSRSTHSWWYIPCCLGRADTILKPLQISINGGTLAVDVFGDPQLPDHKRVPQRYHCGTYWEDTLETSPDVYCTTTVFLPFYHLRQETCILCIQRHPGHLLTVP